MDKGPVARRVMRTVRDQRKTNSPEVKEQRGAWYRMRLESSAEYRLSESILTMRPKIQWLKQDRCYKVDQELADVFTKGPV